MVVLKFVKFGHIKSKKLPSPEGTAVVQYTCTYLHEEKKKRQEVLCC